MNIYEAYYHSPIGWLRIIGTNNGIYALRFSDENYLPDSPIPKCLQKCVEQLDEYFHQNRKNFSLKLLPQGTDFQRTVWKLLMNIPYGRTLSYMEIALKLADKKAVRAVGKANRDNPIPILIPCHRIIGRNGNLVGYGGGIWRKEWLLQHEGVIFC